MKRLWLVLLLTCTAPAAFGQSDQRLKNCFKTAVTQSAMDVCANEQAQRAEAQLNKTYRQLLALAKKDPVAVTKIEKAEAIWISYRKAYMEAMYPASDKQAAYGTIFPMEVDLPGARLAHQQTNALRAIIKMYSDDK